MAADDADHKAFVAEVFGRTADRYDRIGTPVFSPLGRRLVELAEIAPGSNVLDVATGTGAVLVPAAEAAGPGGYVLGIDLSPEMVHAAARAIEHAGLRQAEARIMDAERMAHLPDGEFDVVLCACALAFFPHPERALAEFHRVLRPGGTAGISRWRDADPRWDWYAELLNRFGVEERTLMAGSPDPAAALAEAGFENAELTTEEFEIVFADEQEWWEWTWAMPYRAALEKLPDDARERFRVAAWELVRELRERDGIRRRAEALFAVARRPAP